MRLFITGIKGQLGSEIARQAKSDHDVIGGDLPEFDITNRSQVAAAFAAQHPTCVIHCAAFTNVDAAARDPETAYRINGLGTQNIALACAEQNIEILYLSSNEVFDGNTTQPYREFDSTNPINPYGYSKLAGEEFTQQIAARHYIVRTSWLTSAGGRNFVHRIQQLADEQSKLRVVTDEVACPTFGVDLAQAILKVIVTHQYGIYHLVNEGYCSRYDYAQKILELTNRSHIPIEPITLADFPRPSTPPKFTPLTNLCGAALGITLRGWEEALKEFLVNK
ncbi:MAG: dTDP-4-dehydrorhamnose reductase [Chloroflexi bacterium]|nr:dTDP-4-dehydrorhamnose reductase [Chloroflexota bacterium]